MPEITPSMEQTLKQAFAENFFLLAQQKTSLLSNTPAVETVSFKGKYLFTTRAGSTEMLRKDSMHDTWDDEDFTADQRKQKYIRFAKSFKVDAKQAQEMITDPNSVIYQQLEAALNRQKDRSVLQAAIAPVMVGDMESTATEVSAAEDGVITIDATSGMNYEKFLEAHQNFINNSISIGSEANSSYILPISGKEHTNLMMEEKFINGDFSRYYPVEKGKMSQANGIGLAVFAGSTTGNQILNPVIPEDGTNRFCPLMAPGAIKLGLRNVKFVMEKISGTIESYRIGVSCHVSALRTEGARVQIFKTTI